MTFYDEMQGVAKELLAEFDQGGVSYIAITPGNGTGDAPGPSVETVYPIDAVVRGVAFKYVDNAMVVASDLQLTIPGGGVVPTIGGFVTTAQGRYKVVQVIPKPATGVVAAYTLIFRK